MNESEVLKIIEDELSHYIIFSQHGVKISNRILEKIRAYIVEEKHYRRSRIISKVIIYRIFGIGSGFIIGLLLTGRIDISVELTVIIETVHTLFHYLLERFYG